MLVKRDAIDAGRWFVRENTPSHVPGTLIGGMSPSHCPASPGLWGPEEKLVHPPRPGLDPTRRLERCDIPPEQEGPLAYQLGLPYADETARAARRRVSRGIISNLSQRGNRAGWELQLVHLRA